LFQRQVKHIQSAGTSPTYVNQNVTNPETLYLNVKVQISETASSFKTYSNVERDEVRNTQTQNEKKSISKKKYD